jgi:hypothetical protein
MPSRAVGTRQIDDGRPGLIHDSRLGLIDHSWHRLIVDGDDNRTVRQRVGPGHNCRRRA